MFRAYIRVGVCILIVFYFSSVASADQTVYFVSPADTIANPDTAKLNYSIQPAALSSYPQYTYKWIWSHRNQFALCKIIAPDSIVSEISALGWPKITDTEVASNVDKTSGYNFYGRIGFLAY